MSRGDGNGFWAEGREEELGSGGVIGTVHGLKTEQRDAGEESWKRNPEGIEREKKKNG